MATHDAVGGVRRQQRTKRRPDRRRRSPAAERRPETRDAGLPSRTGALDERRTPPDPELRRRGELYRSSRDEELDARRTDSARSRRRAKRELLSSRVGERGRPPKFPSLLSREFARRRGLSASAPRTGGGRRIRDPARSTRHAGGAARVCQTKEATGARTQRRSWNAGGTPRRDEDRGDPGDGPFRRINKNFKKIY